MCRKVSYSYNKELERSCAAGGTLGQGLAYDRGLAWVDPATMGTNTLNGPRHWVGGRGTENQ